METIEAYPLPQCETYGISNWNQQIGTIKSQKETSPLAHFVRNSLPHKSHRFCSPMLYRRHIAILWFPETVYDIWSQAKSRPRIFVRYAHERSLCSLNSAHQVALRGRRIPSPARYSFAALAITSLPDSPALRLQPYIGIRFLLTIGVYHELVNSNRITLYERQAKSRPRIFVRYAHERSLCSLNSAHQVALRGRRIPSPARYSFAALAITALPDSPALRREPKGGILFMFSELCFPYSFI